MINFSYRKVGGLMFVKLGRFCFSFCITNEYRSLNEPSPQQAPVGACCGLPREVTIAPSSRGEEMLLKW